jgi:hypothetical protein
MSPTLKVIHDLTSLCGAFDDITSWHISF